MIDDRARWPQYNITDVVNYTMKNPGVEEFDVLVLAAPTVDITNLDTSKLTPTDDTAAFQQSVITSTQNMFSLAEVSLEQNKSLRKVVIMEHLPRFDNLDVDPTSLKPNLVKLANATLSQLWLNSPIKHKISIGYHSLNSSGVGAAHVERYQNQNTGRYDGVHLYGRTGCKDYTKSLRNILISAQIHQNPTQTKTQCDQTQQKDNHMNCPQANFQKEKTFHPSVKTNNRFNVLNSPN